MCPGNLTRNGHVIICDVGIRVVGTMLQLDFKGHGGTAPEGSWSSPRRVWRQSRAFHEEKGRSTLASPDYPRHEFTYSQEISLSTKVVR